MLGKKIMIFKPELSPQNFHYDVLYPLYSGFDDVLSQYFSKCAVPLETFEIMEEYVRLMQSVSNKPQSIT